MIGADGAPLRLISHIPALLLSWTNTPPPGPTPSRTGGLHPLSGPTRRSVGAACPCVLTSRIVHPHPTPALFSIIKNRVPPRLRPAAFRHIFGLAPHTPVNLSKLQMLTMVHSQCYRMLRGSMYRYPAGEGGFKARALTLTLPINSMHGARLTLYEAVALVQRHVFEGVQPPGWG